MLCSLQLSTNLQEVAPRAGTMHLQTQLACSSTVLMFDNIVASGSFTPVPAGYGGLQYTQNLLLFDAREFSGTGAGTGDVSPYFTIGNGDGQVFAL